MAEYLSVDFLINTIYIIHSDGAEMDQALFTQTLFIALQCARDKFHNSFVYIHNITCFPWYAVRIALIVTWPNVLDYVFLLSWSYVENIAHI